jgi:O-antigen ligase
MSDSGLNGRVPLWIKLIDGMSIDNLRGWGFSGYRDMIFSLSGGWAVHAHNSILDGILAAGYVGAVALIGYLLYGLLRSRRGFKPVPPALCQCLIWYAVFDGMMGPTWLDPYQIMYLSAAIYWTQAAAGSQNRYRLHAALHARSPASSVFSGLERALSKVPLASGDARPVADPVI